MLLLYNEQPLVLYTGRLKSHHIKKYSVKYSMNHNHMDSSTPLQLQKQEFELDNKNVKNLKSNKTE